MLKQVQHDWVGGVDGSFFVIPNLFRDLALQFKQDAETSSA